MIKYITMISHNGQNFPLEIEFVLFDKINAVTPSQKEIKERLFDGDDLKNVIKRAIKYLPSYELLKRVEPGLSSPDEQMQLRLDDDTIHRILPKYQHSLYFHQHYCKKYFTMEQLIDISKKIKTQLEKYLGYEIDTNLIMCIDIDNM